MTATKTNERSGTRAVHRYCGLSASKARQVLDLIPRRRGLRRLEGCANKAFKEGIAALSRRIGINETAPAAAVERLPLPFGLGEAIGHGIDDGRMMPHAAMAAFDLDAF